MHHHIIASILAAGLLCGGVTAAGAQSYPAPPPPRDPDALGRGIQRTMGLLAISTPAHHNKVRILFYGQSITEQEWSKMVADDLRKRFPNADLEIENRAIGGFASQLLVRTAEHDLYPFYPDLLIFHVYGSNKEYEDIIHSVRSRTTAEVLMQRDHLTKWPPTVIDEKQDKGMWWDDLMNNHFLPDTAKKYGCGPVDVRGAWIDYLRANHLEPAALLKDGVHLNDHGNYLMAEVIKRYLVYRPEMAKDSGKEMVRTYRVDHDVKWANGRLTLEFTGNRVDVIPAPGGTVNVLIDGKKPSQIPEVYAITRPQPGPWSPLFVRRIDHETPLLAEDWSLKITSVNADSTEWTYEVSGSVTGPDGAGSSKQPFRSRSGRVRIAPDDFFRNGVVPAGYECHWKAYPMAMDTYSPPPILDSAHDQSTTIVQGLPNTRHTLELIAESGAKCPVSALRIYCPPIAP